MYSVLDKDTIALEIVLYIPKTNRGFVPTVPLAEIINAILYKLKTGVQWHQLPVKALFDHKVLSWQSVYYHYRKWCLCGFWKDCWVSFLNRHKSKLDLSSVDLDGSHTSAIKGGEQVEYQARKKRKTTNAWMDSFRSLLNRFDTTVASWTGFNYLAFIVLALKKFKLVKKKKV